MKIYGPILILLWLVVPLLFCTSSRTKTETKQRFYKRTGEAIAIDSLIQKYENEHIEFYKQETKDGNNFGWPDLCNKDLSIYCRKYLQLTNPIRKNNENAIGIRIKATLLYEKENLSFSRNIVIVHCKVINNTYQTSYYITRAPEPNCVYTLKCTGNKFIYTIINKYCDFEGKPLINCSLKRKRIEIVNKKHQQTGQPIANDEYLLKYELEHQEFLKNIGEEGKSIEWPYAMDNHNLKSYCHQYMDVCVPRRKQGNITWRSSTQKLLYQKLDTNEEVDVTVITCIVPVLKRHYHMTRAPEQKCVYALLRQGHNGKFPLVIIFKHCDFEHSNVQQTNSQDNDISINNVIQQSEEKEETIESVKTLPLFPKS